MIPFIKNNAISHQIKKNSNVYWKNVLKNSIIYSLFTYSKHSHSWINNFRYKSYYYNKHIYIIYIYCIYKLLYLIMFVFYPLIRNELWKFNVQHYEYKTKQHSKLRVLLVQLIEFCNEGCKCPPYTNKALLITENFYSITI